MTQSRTVNSAKNVIMVYMNQIVNIFLQFLSRTVFIYTLGISYLGFSGLFSDVLKLLSLADLGFSSVMAYTFYEPLAKKDKSKIAALVKFYRKVYRIIALAVAVLGICIIPFLDMIVNTEKPIPNLRLYYLLYLTNSVMSYLFVYKTTLLVADQKNYIIVKLKTKINFIVTIAQMVFLLLTSNFILYLLIMNLSTFLQNIVPSRQVDKLYPEIKKDKQLSKSESKSILENLKSVFIYKLSGTFINSTDNILISVLVGTIWVGYYSNYLLIIGSITMFVTGIFTSMTASVGNLLVTEKPEKRLQIFNSEQVLSFIVAGVVVPCFCLLANDFIYVWLGKGFVLDKLVVYAISINFYLTCIFQPLWSFREASGLFRKIRYIMTFTAVINLILSIVLGRMIGLPGIFIATAISKLSTYFWYEPNILFKEYFHKSSKVFYKETFKNVIFLGFLIYLTGKITEYISVDTWFSWLAKAIIIGALSLVLSLLFYRKSEGFNFLILKIKSVLKKVLASQNRKDFKV
ncbi:transporter [Priestia megaterium]|uniref:lipopolysaccharide biosynthesis protein n=1 Tax=Priestia megaterium TaxID=1404 RepID=UPI000BFA7E90|nr:transporter [Priestia megaterium]PEX10223.1 transporter [Priestia megaterium]